MKKKIAFVLALFVLAMALAGCTGGSLENYPNGTRPDSIDGAKLYPKFPTRSAVASELNYYATGAQNAMTKDVLQGNYDKLLETAFIYVMGPYNIANFYATDGGDLSLYMEEMSNLLEDFLGNYEKKAWTAMASSQWSAELVSQYSSGAVTPDKVRNAYPTTTTDGQQISQAFYDTRDALAQAVADDAEEGVINERFNEALTARKALAKNMGYEDFISYFLVKRDNVPYKRDDLLTLASLAKDKLVPAYSAGSDALFPALAAQDWMTAMPTLIQRFPAYEQDLLYCLNNGLLTVEAVREEQLPISFSYALYHYGVSMGKARTDGSFDDARLVGELLGSMSRDMTMPKGEWSVGIAQMADQVQKKSFTVLFSNELDVVYGDMAGDAKAQMERDMLKNSLDAAMRYEIAYELYTRDSVSVQEIEELAQRMASSYGVALSAMDIYSMDELLAGTMDSVQELIGGLTGLQLLLLSREDAGKAQEVVARMLECYNYSNPVSEAVKVGLDNPFSSAAIEEVAMYFANK